MSEENAPLLLALGSNFRRLFGREEREKSYQARLQVRQNWIKPFARDTHRDFPRKLSKGGQVLFGKEKLQTGPALASSALFTGRRR